MTKIAIGEIMKNEIIPQYDVRKSEYTIQEKMLLGEMRENLVDMSINRRKLSGFRRETIIDIKNPLFLRLSGENQNTDISNEYLDHLSRRVLRDIIGYGKIDPLIQDDELEEIMIIGTSKPIFVYHRQYGMMKTDLQFESDEELRDLIDSIARQINRRIDQETPILDGRLVDGSRINATIPPFLPTDPHSQYVSSSGTP